MNQNLVAYYKERAKEYENTHPKPERQEDLKKATAVLQNLFSKKTVLEIACGYWTERIAETATSICATDINENVINIAKKSNIKPK